jgi:hypothetical protein
LFASSVTSSDIFIPVLISMKPKILAAARQHMTSKEGNYTEIAEVLATAEIARYVFASEAGAKAIANQSVPVS